MNKIEFCGSYHRVPYYEVCKKAIGEVISSQTFKLRHVYYTNDTGGISNSW